MNPVLGDLHRRTHRTTGTKLKHKPLPLHSIAPRHCWRPQWGSADRMYRASPRPLSSSRIETFWRANLPWVESVMRVNAAFTLRSSAKSSSPKNAGLIQRENLCRARPTTNHRISQSRHHVIRNLLHQNLLLRIAHTSAGRTCNTPAST